MSAPASFYYFNFPNRFYSIRSEANLAKEAVAATAAIITQPKMEI